MGWRPVAAGGREEGAAACVLFAHAKRLFEGLGTLVSLTRVKHLRVRVDASLDLAAHDQLDQLGLEVVE